MIEFRKLRADEIDVRVGQMTKDKSKMTLLLYKNARVDMALLDEVVGPYNWQREHKELKGVLYCGVSLRDTNTGEWVTKWDAGTESNTEAQKGEASDSFKRACVNWGLGRELYTAPRVWVPASISTYDLYVSEITYNAAGEIERLTICNKSGVVWTNAQGAPKNTQVVNPTPTAQKPVETPKNVIYAQDKELSEREQDEYAAAMADADAAETVEQLKATWERYKAAAFNGKLAQHIIGIKTIKGWK